MIGWLRLTPDQRRATLEQAFIRSGMQSKAIEKDWWVTLCLKALFQTPYGKYCLFKGGTSLSKAWKLIQRFSEDVDIALAPEAFGMTYQEPPSHMYVKNMKRRGCTFTSTILKEALETAFADMGVPPGLVTVEAEEIPHDRPDKDPQTLFIRYPSLFDTHLYLLDEVKMEFGVRSFRDPHAQVPVQSILSEVFPNPAYEETPFEVSVVEPRKTLLEKMFLLHEKFHTDRYGPVHLERQSRHPYDIVSLLATPAATQVLEDRAFYDRLLAHRKNYVRLSGIDYETLTPRQLRFVPYTETVETFRSDYEAMQQSMIYGPSPAFDVILQQLKYFNGQVRLMGTGLDLQDVIEQFLHAHKTSMDAEPKQLRYKNSVIMITSDDLSISCQLTFHNLPGGWTFEELNW
jgi:Nucleotidyl transferase AbiEii toxin, Type IV TA system